MGVEVVVFQGGSVVAKSLTTNPLLMLLIRDILQFTFQVPASSPKSFSCVTFFCKSVYPDLFQVPPALFSGHDPFPQGE